MSFDVFVQSFQDGEFAGLSRQRVREAFGLALHESEPNFWQLRYGEGRSSDLYIDVHDPDPSQIHGFTVNRPCTDEQLWDSLIAILTLGNVVLYFPGCRAPLVTHASVAQHLPAEIIEALGEPIIVTSGEDIQREIREA
jgi:hypothetical protein